MRWKIQAKSKLLSTFVSEKKKQYNTDNHGFITTD